MKNVLLSLLMVVSFTTVSVSQEKTSKKLNEQLLQKNRAMNDGVFYGKIALKSIAGKKKLNTFKGVILVIRDRATKRIIARTTTDASGSFKFNNMTIRKGLEIGWSSGIQASEPIGEDGCYAILPYDHTTLEPMEECDDSVLVLRIGLSNCKKSPCPWEIKGKKILEN
jgi:hypothetical protein